MTRLEWRIGMDSSGDDGLYETGLHAHSKFGFYEIYDGGDEHHWMAYGDGKLLLIGTVEQCIDSCNYVNLFRMDLEANG